MKYFPLGLVVGFTQFCHGQLKDCFHTNGNPSFNLPCDPDAEASICCGTDSICKSSLYCLGADSMKKLGSCTDRSFKDNACPFPLKAPGKDGYNDGVFDYTKNATICPDKTVCPYAGNKTCCDAGAGKTEIIFYYGDNRIPSARNDLSSFYALAGYTLPPTSTSSSPISTDPASSIDGGAASASRTALLSSNQSTSSAETPKPSPGLSNSAKAGIGIGIGLATALLVCLAVFLLRRHRKRRTMARAEVSVWPVPATEEIDGKPVPAELNGADRMRPEMSGEPARAELTGSGRDRS